MKEDVPDYSRVASGSKARGAVRVRLFKFVSEQLNAITCHTWDGTTEGTDEITIAKSPLLRGTPTHGGISYSYSVVSGKFQRTATLAPDSEKQVITPGFVVGDLIVADRGVIGGTGLANVEWMDQNRDGRAWAKKAT